jgi:hypothetical protein
MLAAVWGRVSEAVGALPDSAFTAPGPPHRPGLSAVVGDLLDEITATVADLRAPSDDADPATTLAAYLPRLARLPAQPPEPPGRPPQAPERLRQRLAAAAAEASEVLDADAPAAVIGPAGPVLRTVYLEIRLISAVAIGRDLPEPLLPGRAVLRHCVRLLARALAALAPGRSVELRVPPHVAVQCVQGPRHTRGTPPNVVEIEPVGFLELATERRDWTSALESGVVRASGERADLRPWLPLLGRGHG